MWGRGYEMQAQLKGYQIHDLITLLKCKFIVELNALYEDQLFNL
jgi:hypothetical protein